MNLRNIKLSGKQMVYNTMFLKFLTIYLELHKQMTIQFKKVAKE